MELYGKTVYGPVLKTTQLSAHVQNYASPERCRKSFTMIFLGDHDIPLTGSNNLTAFRAIFSHIVTAHAQERPFMNFIIRFLDPDFLIGHAISAIRGRFLLIFALDKLNVHHISTSALDDQLT